MALHPINPNRRMVHLVACILPYGYITHSHPSPFTQLNNTISVFQGLKLPFFQSQSFPSRFYTSKQNDQCQEAHQNGKEVAEDGCHQEEKNLIAKN